MTENEISAVIVDAGIQVHRALGPGLLESAYEACLCHELRKSGLSVQSQVDLPVEYDGVVLEVGYRLDILIEGKVIVEVKAVKEIAPIHQAQLMSYLKLSGMKLGLLMNFHETRLKDGIRRLVNGL